MQTVNIDGFAFGALCRDNYLPKSCIETYYHTRTSIINNEYLLGDKVAKPIQIVYVSSRKIPEKLFKHASLLTKMCTMLWLL